MATAVILDQHYTDSLFRTVSMQEYKTCGSYLPLKRSIDRHEVLATLLMFDKAYLAQPTWLKALPSRAVEQLTSHGVIEWVPDRCYRNSFHSVCSLADATRDAAISFHLIQDALGYTEEATYRIIRMPGSGPGSNLVFQEDLSTALFVLHQLLYPTPSVYSSAGHLGMQRGTVLCPLLYPLQTGNLTLLPSEHEIADYLGVDRYDFWKREFAGTFLARHNWFCETHSDVLAAEKWIATFVKDQAIAHESLLTSNALELFATETGHPIKTNFRARQEDRFIGGANGAYQLISIQLRELHYPVIESLEDVLRLRNDRNIERWREVIREYVVRLQAELEEERAAVLGEFQNDLRLATKSLNKIAKWKTVDNFSLIVSLPLLVVGLLVQLPLTDMVLLPASIVSRVVRDVEKKRIRWAMFGRP